MKILFQGFYGFQNSGDDAFVEVCAWGAKKYWQTENNVFLSSNLPIVTNPAKSISKPLFTGHNRLQTFMQSLNADAYISAGGSTFSDHNKYSLKAVASFVRKNFNKKLKVGAIGVSIGPFKNKAAEKRVIETLKNMDFLALRDQRSYQFSASLNLPYAPVDAFDLAALLPSVYEEMPKKLGNKQNQKVVGISVCNYERYIGGDLSNEKRRNKRLLEIISSIPNDPSLVFRFFVFNGHSILGDKALTEEFVSQLPDRNIEVIPYNINLKQTWDLISDCDLVISTRLHASIFACYAGVPFFLTEYHRKCTDFLNDVGQHDKYRLLDAEVSVKEILPEIMAILHGKAITPMNITETIRKSTKNFTEINIF